MTISNPNSSSDVTGNKFFRYLTIGLAALAGAPARACQHAQGTALDRFVAARLPSTYDAKPTPCAEPSPTFSRRLLRPSERFEQRTAQALTDLSADAHVYALAHPELKEAEALSADAYVQTLAKG